MTRRRPGTAILALVASLGLFTGLSQAQTPSPKQPATKTQTSGAGLMDSNPPLFGPTIAYKSGGQYSTSLAVGDVNGDGKPDLVVANYCGNSASCPFGTASTVGVLLGNGDGTFQAAVAYDAGGAFAYSVAVADLNGDGKPDIVLSTFFGNWVDVLLNKGDGTFQPAVTYNSGGYYGRSVVVADVNHDGKPDLLVANAISGTVGVLLGNGDGTFQPAVTYGSGPTAEGVAVADVNGDGNLDLVVANDPCGDHFTCDTEGSVSVLLGKGDGTFRPAVTYSSAGYRARSVAVADVNNDGNPDLVVANTSSVPSSQLADGTVSVLLGKGDGTFQPAITHDSGGLGFIYGTSVAVADFNRDGKLAVVATNFYSHTAGVLLGNGDGTFQAAVPFDGGGTYTSSVAVADLNLDGRPDLVLANAYATNSGGPGSVGVLLNNTGVKSSTSTTLTSSLNPSVYGQKVTWTATVTSSASITPTGRVNFTWDGNSIGSATLNASGVASLTKSNLNADPYPLTAVYSGDVSNLRSTSAIVNQVVTETTSAATLTSSPNPSTQGQAVTFTAKITSPTVIPKGPVTFTAGKTVLGTAQLSGGKATLTISSLAVGSTKVTATYYGDSNIAKSSASVVQTVR